MRASTCPVTVAACITVWYPAMMMCCCVLYVYARRVNHDATSPSLQHCHSNGLVVQSFKGHIDLGMVSGPHACCLLVCWRLRERAHAQLTSTAQHEWCTSLGCTQRINIDIALDSGVNVKVAVVLADYNDFPHREAPACRCCLVAVAAVCKGDRDTSSIMSPC